MHFFACLCISVTFINSDSKGCVAVEGGGEEKQVQVKLEDILIFATGAAEIPPMGFSEQPTVVFKSKHEVGNVLPSASTCVNRMYLPVHDTYETFKCKFLLGITCAIGFGTV